MSHASKATGRSSYSSSLLLGRGERLAPRGAVDEAEHGAVRAELGAEVLVREQQTVARDLVLIQHKLVRGRDADPVRRRLDDRQLARRRPCDLPPLERRRVHRAAADRRERCRCDRVRAGLDLGQIALGVLVDEPDRRAGKDVVELLQEEELPQAVELLARVVAAGDGREELRVVQRDLARAGCRASYAPASCTCRGGTRSRARRGSSGARPAPPRAPRRAPSGAAILVRGKPCRSRARSIVSIIARVGPPPPSP